MGRKGEQTREQILIVSESIILQRGYSGTSIEDIIKEAGITKGGFFYHFDGKNDLAKNLMLRYLEIDAKFFYGLIERAGELTEDPLQRFLIFLNLIAENMADLPGTHPGCLVASFTYEARQFDDEVRDLNAQGVLSWRSIFAEQIGLIRDKYPMRLEMGAEELADMLTAVIEGGIIVSKVLDQKEVLPNKLLQYRSYIRLLFEDA